MILFKKKYWECYFSQKSSGKFSIWEIFLRSLKLKIGVKTLGELFCFFILETILIGRALIINPYNQPAVELIKKETKNF